MVHKSGSFLTVICFFLPSVMSKRPDPREEINKEGRCDLFPLLLFFFSPSSIVYLRQFDEVFSLELGDKILKVDHDGLVGDKHGTHVGWVVKTDVVAQRRTTGMAATTCPTTSFGGVEIQRGPVDSGAPFSVENPLL